MYEGARKKDEDWNPEENGGFAIHGKGLTHLITSLTPDTEAPSAAEPPADAFAHIEKTVDQQTWVKTKSSRLTELQNSADRLSSDPYVVSSALRRKFREEKKIMLEKQGRDDDFRAKYGIHEDVDLGTEDVEKSREMWAAGRERAGLPIEEPDIEPDASVRAVNGTPTHAAKEKTGGPVDLAKVLRTTTAKKYDPFDGGLDSFFSVRSETPKVKPKPKDRPTAVKTPAASEQAPLAKSLGLGGGLLAGYDSD